MRNPIKIAEFAQCVIQDGAKNLLDYGVLRSPIEISTSTNLVDGQLIIVDGTNLFVEDALETALEKIPHGNYALAFVDDREMTGNIPEAIKKGFSKRNDPGLFTGLEETGELKKWLCSPEKRQNDMCIIGVQHQCNGIETEIVIHIYPGDCPLCKISNADPVIISRAKAMLIVSTYQRVQCSCCGWKLHKETIDDGWTAFKDASDNEEEITVLPVTTLVPNMNQNINPQKRVLR